MSRITKKALSLIMALTIAVPLTITSASAQGKAPQGLDENLEYIGKLIKFVQVYHAGEEVTEDELIQGAMKGVFYNLDPYSKYYTEEEFEELNEDVSGNFGGIGVRIIEKDGYVTVLAPIEGTPGFKAGIKADDKIVLVDGEDIVGYTSKQAMDIMRGEPGTEIKIGILRENVSGILYFDIVREIIEINPISHEILEDNIGYIKITEFNQNTLRNIEDVLKELDKEGIEDIVIDLRNNPGGFLTQVIEMSKYFVPEGPIVHVKNADGKTDSYKSTNKDPKYNLAVLVNRGSASASEIFAGAVKDTGVGKIIGAKTFGKGSVQKMIPLTNGGGIKLTIAEYLTPNKNKVNGIGITPDIVVETRNKMDGIDPLLISKLDKSREIKEDMVGLDILAAEEILDILGYDTGKVDGVYDDSTVKAVKKFEEKMGLSKDGKLDIKSQEELLQAIYDYTHEDMQLEKAIEVLKR
ncbi:S41 family peptidase [Clostridiisalibacter paucivorans]|uniref:S41 family peptidase n=1 Tax=Clostridiisalibacter paucivorans TaxID=408753 RepID=UPI000551029F|nr:S41 family peptidase [Clostridiisalibacter paucivorans]